MKSTYSEFDGDRGRFRSPDDLFAPPGLVDFIIEYGQEGLDALPQHPDEQIQQLVQDLKDAGLVEDDAEGGLRMTPRMVRGMEHRALLEIFRELKPGVKEGHESPFTGNRGERSEGTRPHQFGDPVSEVAMLESLRNAIARNVVEQQRSGQQVAAANLLPLRLRDADLEVYNSEASADTATAILIDLSGSMMRYGRHVAAKRVALGMQALINRRFPNDTVDYIGFASTAEHLREQDIPLVMPKPITTRDWEVRVRIPLDRAGETHLHLTNLHHGLRLARQALAKRGAANKQIFIITDGQPTAHLSGADPAGMDAPGQDATMLNLIYPPSRETVEATLKEAFTCRQRGIRISSFALIEEYHAMEWVGFIDQLTQLVRGVSFYCTAGDLGSAIIESYLTGKREKKSLG